MYSKAAYVAGYQPKVYSTSAGLGLGTSGSKAASSSINRTSFNGSTNKVAGTSYLDDRPRKSTSNTFSAAARNGVMNPSSSMRSKGSTSKSPGVVCS